MTTIFIIGRILFGGFFLMSAYSHFRHVGMLAGYAASKGVPQAKASVIGSGVLLLIAGLSIMTGIAPGIGILAGLLFLIPTSFIMHAYWKDQDPAAKSSNRIQFQKNMALVGALLMLALNIAAWPAVL
jgi:putative oxidoreductase